MTVRKLSISVPEEIAVHIEQDAKAEGMSISAWVAQSVADSHRRRDGMAAVAEWEAENGVIDDRTMERVAEEFAAIDTKMFGPILDEDRGR